MKSVAASLLSLAVIFGLAAPSGAQSVDKVRTDVLSALSTPLPITIVGPLLTRDVTVSEEGEGFRAVLEDTSLMGLFRFGEVSFHMAPLDAESYRITDLQFSRTLDFPGMGTLTFSGMEFDGIWSAKSRSYDTLNWLTRDLTFRPDMGAPQSTEQGAGAGVSMGSLRFDVLKEPEGANTESRFEISAGTLAVTGMGPQDVTLGEVRARLAANGERPVDLYSVLREVLMLATMRDGGAQLQTLGQSLLGNNYDTVTLDLTARDLTSISAFDRDSSHFNAGSMSIKAALSEVAPRHWGGAEVTVGFGDVDQRNFLPDSTLRLENALLRISGGDLPVADMMAAAMTLAEPPRRRPVPASLLFDGLLGFGKLELASEGKAIWVEGFRRRFRDGETTRVKEFETSFDSWGVKVALLGFDKSEGRLVLGTDVAGGDFRPGEIMPQEIMPHINAWFPRELSLHTRVSNLNEGLLRQMFKDVEIANMREPLEVILPLVLYAASTVMDVEVGENVYETGLFRLSQVGNYRLYPTELFDFFPYEGEMRMTLTGLPQLLAYIDDTVRATRPGSEEAMALGAAKSGLIVLGNLAKPGDDGAMDWTIRRPDVMRREIELNGIVLRYPNIMQYLPMFGMMSFRL